MQETKKVTIQWNMVALNVVGIVVCYLLLQLLNALLIARELVGEGRGPLLICLSAFLAVLLSSLIFLRREHTGRLPLCLGCAFLFLAVVLLTAMALGGEVTAGRPIILLALSVTAGGTLAALLGGGRRKNRRSKRR